ncbi:MAG: hypothetical protein QOE22_660 [Candidatus Parcubacteria bacterium]|jgi:hypothetical protein|nr:hypothetical protein [Candidatus Parcubacteria bacterium]
MTKRCRNSAAFCPNPQGDFDPPVKIGFMTRKREKKPEPTLHDILAATQALDDRLTIEMHDVLSAIQTLDKRLTTEIEGVVEIMGTRFLIVDKKLIAIHDRVENLSEQLSEVKRRVGTVERIMLEVQDELDDSLAIRDKDAETVVDHERRITRLETATQ